MDLCCNATTSIEIVSTEVRPIIISPSSHNESVGSARSALYALLVSQVERRERAQRWESIATFRTMPFPQPCYPTGWWSATLARKSCGFDFRKADAPAKTFNTKCYSADILTGALVYPPFVAEALGE
jgi:spermidine synthase